MTKEPPPGLGLTAGPSRPLRIRAASLQLALGFPLLTPTPQSALMFLYPGTSSAWCSSFNSTKRCARLQATWGHCTSVTSTTLRWPRSSWSECPPPSFVLSVPSLPAGSLPWAPSPHSATLYTLGRVSVSLYSSGRSSLCQPAVSPTVTRPISFYEAPSW